MPLYISYNLESRRTTSFFQNPSKRNFSLRSPTGDFPSFPGGRPKGEEFKNVPLAPSHPAALAVGACGGPVLLRPGRQARRGQGQGQDASSGRSSRCRWQDRRRRAGRQVQRWEPDLRSRGAAEEGKRSLFSKFMWENRMLDKINIILAQSSRCSAWSTSRTLAASPPSRKREGRRGKK